MWITNTDGFFSVVLPKRTPLYTQYWEGLIKDGDYLLVRSRDIESIETMLQRLAENGYEPENGYWTGRIWSKSDGHGSDYAYRVLIPVEIWSIYLKLTAYDMKPDPEGRWDFHDFKGTAMRVWTTKYGYDFAYMRASALANMWRVIKEMWNVPLEKPRLGEVKDKDIRCHLEASEWEMLMDALEHYEDNLANRDWDTSHRGGEARWNYMTAWEKITMKLAGIER